MNGKKEIPFKNRTKKIKGWEPPKGSTIEKAMMRLKARGKKHERK